MYIPGSQRGDIYPIIYRQYIYFVSGLDNKEKFQKDPLKYTTQDDSYYPLFPIRVAVIGPPKCGKTICKHLIFYFCASISYHRGE
ncbi:Adenylate kinase 9 [Blattella germanica]|nr:Adenylate kinase 9 [Blattella germanica]